jgi:hypothetical protein
MPYRLKGRTQLVCAKDQQGKVVYYWANPVNGPGRPEMKGPYIPWLDDAKAAQLLRIRFIERIDDDPPDSIVAAGAFSAPTAANTAVPVPEPQLNTPSLELDTLLLDESCRSGLDPDRVRDCIEAITALGIPVGTGAPKVREALRADGQQWSNDLVCAAVRAHKTLSGTAAL